MGKSQMTKDLPESKWKMHKIKVQRFIYAVTVFVQNWRFTWYECMYICTVISPEPNVYPIFMFLCIH